MILRHDRDDRRALHDQRQRTVLEFAAGIGLRVNVGDLFELERAFHGDRVVDRTADEEHVFRETVMFGERLDHFRIFKNFVAFFRRLDERGNNRFFFLARQIFVDPSEVHREQQQRHQLRRVRFGGRDRNFRTGDRIHHRVRFARDRRTHRIGHGEALRAAAFRFFQRRQRVARFARLADYDAERVFVRQRIAVPVFRRDIHFDRNARDLLDVIFRYKTRVVRRTTGRN